MADTQDCARGSSWPSEESMCTIIDSSAWCIYVDKLSELLLSSNNREGILVRYSCGLRRKGILCERCVACLSAGNDYILVW
jgi:hypothetical protein